MILLDLNPPLAGHVAVALARHRQALRREQLTVPDGFGDLLDAMTRLARQGRDTTDLASATDLSDYAPVPAPLLLTKAEAAEALSMSVRNLDRVVASGRLQAVRTGAASVRIRRVDLEAYVASLEPVSGPGFDPRMARNGPETGAQECTSCIDRTPSLPASEVVE